MILPFFFAWDFQYIGSADGPVIQVHPGSSMQKMCYAPPRCVAHCLSP